MRAVLQPLPPRDAIAAFEARRGDLRETFSWQELWEQEHARSFTVAKSAGFDILSDIESAFSKALVEGQTPAQFARNLRPTLMEKGWWGKKLVFDPMTGEPRPVQLGSERRLRTIFDTNMRVSYAAGHWASFERYKTTQPYLRYVALLDDCTRPSHRARHNLVLPVDHPYWNQWSPPCGWNCRCTLQALSERDVKRLQAEGEELRFEPPADTFRRFVNSRTGEISEVPDGIDPGWAYNPGRAGYEASINRAFAEKVADAPYELLTAAVQERLSSAAFRRFMVEPQGSMPVMAISPAIAQSLNIDARVALLSQDTMRKQLGNHPEMTIDDYRLLATFPEAATLAVSDGPFSIVLVRLDSGRWLHAVIKATKSRKAAFVTSFRITGADRIPALLERPGAKVLFDRREE